MIIKKFLGKTEEEAIAIAKKELGNDVVVMNVKKNVKKKGMFASFRPKLVEVTVAKEEDDKEKNTSRTGQQQINSALSQSSKTTVINQSLNSENIEKKLDSLQTLLENRFNSAQAANEEKSVSDKIVENTETVVKAAEISENESVEDEEQTRFLKLLYSTMLENEVDEKYANQILDEIKKAQKPNVPMDYLLANVYQKMILKFGKTEEITPAVEGPKVVVFMGPTGVGKTTTIAKIASNYAVDEKKKVALLTSDTYRIAAAEQLKTYANILEVPFKVVYTADELKDSIKDYSDYDYIFVDTAGHSHQNEDQLANMKALLDAVKDICETEIFLVLSATTKYKDLVKIADNYKSITNYRLIFTKLDETDSVGNLLNIRLFTDAAISYVTCGQNVPDDIEAFNAQKTVKQLLGGKR